MAGQVASKGYSAVGLFYALSGFVLAYNYANRRTTYRGFIVARLARIYPVYALALLLALPVFVMHLRADHVPAARALASFVTVPLLIQAWFPQTALTWNTPAWSLSVEAFFYLLFPIILPYCLNASKRRLHAFLIVAWIASMAPSLIYLRGLHQDFGTLAHQSHPFWDALESTTILSVVNFNPVLRLAEFVAGIILGLFFIRRQQAKEVKNGWLVEVISAGAILATLAVLAVPDLAPFPLLHNGGLLPFWCVLIYSLACSQLVAKALSFPILVILGEISYGMYILQQPVSNYLKLALLKAGHIAIKGDYPTAPLFLLYVGVLTAVSYVSYRWIEAPARSWIRKRFAGARASTTAG